MSGKIMTPSVKSATGTVVMVIMSLAAIAASNPLYHVMKGPITTNQPEAPFVDGICVYEVPEPDSRGYKDHTITTMSNGIIVPCAWDSSDAEDNGKQKLSMDDQRIMTDNGLTWKAQADSVGKCMIEHQEIESLANQEGYITDAISTVGISVYPFINGVEECLKQAAE